MSQGAMNYRHDLELKLISRATEDAAFREELLKDPGAALQQMGLALPKGVHVKVVEETANTLYIVLPQQAAGAGAELGDQDLEQVAGGDACSQYYQFGFQVMPVIHRVFAHCLGGPFQYA